MRFLIGVAFLMSMMSVDLNAQLTSSFGLRAGVQYGTIAVANDSSGTAYQGGLGYQVLLNSRWYLADHFMLGLGLGIDQRTFRTENQYSTVIEDYTVSTAAKFTNLNMNLGLDLISNEIGEETYLFFHLGTNLSYNLHNRVDYSTNSILINLPDRQTNLEEFSKINLEARPKVGVVFNTLYGKIEAGVAYQRSLLNIYSEEANGLKGNWNIFSLELGYYF